MRLLPVGHDSDRGRLAAAESASERCRYRCGDDQYLPLRHLCARAQSDPSRRAGVIQMIEGGYMRWVGLLLGLSSGLGAVNAAEPMAVESEAGMVVSSQHFASEAGAAILRQGGNAIDAAVAVGYALAVTHPCCGNLGGGGFMTIHLADGRNTFINFRERAPLAARADMFLDAKGNPVSDQSLNGYLAVGVPGTVLGLDTALREYGTLPLPTLMAASIRLAQDGFILTRGDIDVLDEGVAKFREQPNVASIFLNQGRAFQPGERLVQKNLAATLRAIR